MSSFKFKREKSTIPIDNNLNLVDDQEFNNVQKKDYSYSRCFYYLLNTMALIALSSYLEELAKNRNNDFYNKISEIVKIGSIAALAKSVQIFVLRKKINKKEKNKNKQPTKLVNKFSLTYKKS